MPASKKKLLAKQRLKENKAKPKPKVPQDAQQFKNALDSIEDMMSNISSLGAKNEVEDDEYEDVENDDGDDGMVLSKPGFRQKTMGPNKIKKMSKKMKARKTRNTHKAIEYGNKRQEQVVKAISKQLQTTIDKKAVQTKSQKKNKPRRAVPTMAVDE
ncbi:hypothetical protein AKO1_011238 [Acrasis kona]|uniref:Uncharacterized protein n=1 Tax=Acrasis kona TaxID=1008807 RepID=A0AAW2YWP0_9EUKA